MAKRNFKSRAFRRGFREGFGAPVLLFEPLDFSRVMEAQTSAHEAWAKAYSCINDALEAYKMELSGKLVGDSSFGETTRKGERRSRISA